MSESDGSTDPRAPLPGPKGKLIVAAMDALRELTVADLITAVGTREIARRAGVSATSMFHHFGSVTGLAEAVVARVFDPGTNAAEAIVGMLGDVRATGLPVEATYGLHLAEFHRLTNDPEFHLRMGLWALGGQQAADAYGEYLRVTDARLVDAIKALHESWGRELRPPVTTETFLASLVGLVNGSSVRHYVDPEGMTAEHAARVAAALTVVLLRVKGDRHDLDDRLAEMNYYPLRNARTGLPVKGRKPHTRAMLMATAAELIGAQGYRATTIAQVARKAGLDDSTVYEIFGNKAGLAVALFTKQAEDMVGTRPDVTGTPAEQLRVHLEWIAQFTGNRTEHAPLYLAEISARQPEAGEDPLVASVTALVAEAQQVGEVCRTTEAEDLAYWVVVLLVGRVLNHPAQPFADKVQAVWTALLEP